MTAEGGIEFEYETDFAEFSLGWQHDLFSEHDGYQVEFGVRKPIFLSRYLVAPLLS